MPTCLISRTCGRRCTGRAGGKLTKLRVGGSTLHPWQRDWRAVEYEAQEGREGSEHDVQVATDRNDEDEDELLLADSLRSFVRGR